MGWGEGDGKEKEKEGKAKLLQAGTHKSPSPLQGFKLSHLKPRTPQVAGSPPGRLRQGVGAGTDRWGTAEGNRQLCVQGTQAQMPEVWKYFA